MKRRTFLRFLGLSPAMSAVDVTDVLNNKPLNTSMGLLEFTRTFLPDDYIRMTWMQKASLEWFDKHMNELFRYVGPTRIPRFINHSSTHQLLNGSDNKT